MFSKKFKESPLVKKLDEELLVASDKSKSHKNAISFSVYSLSRWELFKACMSRELLLMRRNSFLYIFKTTQVIIFSFTSFIQLFSVSPLFLISAYFFFLRLKGLRKLKYVDNLFVAAYYCCNNGYDCFSADSDGN